MWLVVEINGSWKPLFLAWLIALNNLRDGREKEFAVFFFFFFLIVLRSCGRKICLNMCHGNSENSNGCPYPLRICFIYGTNVSVSRSVSLRKVLTANKMPFDLPTNECKLKHYHHFQTGFIWKFCREWLLWTEYVSGGSLRKKLQMALKQGGMHFVLNRKKTK